MMYLQALSRSLDLPAANVAYSSFAACASFWGDFSKRGVGCRCDVGYACTTMMENESC